MEHFDMLIEKAKAARQNAYAPYSNYAVGAALLCRDGSIYVGANVESASYGVSLCAERAALAAAVADGKRKFTAIAVYADPAPTPCGICRQALYEFGDLWVVTASAAGTRSTTLSKLLPDGFGRQIGKS